MRTTATSPGDSMMVMRWPWMGTTAEATPGRGDLAAVDAHLGSVKRPARTSDRVGCRRPGGDLPPQFTGALEAFLLQEPAG